MHKFPTDKLQKYYFDEFRKGKLVKFIDPRYNKEKIALICGNPIGRPGRYIFEGNRPGFYFSPEDEHFTLQIPIVYEYSIYNIPFKFILRLDEEE